MKAKKDRKDQTRQERIKDRRKTGVGCPLSEVEVRWTLFCNALISEQIASGEIRQPHEFLGLSATERKAKIAGRVQKMVLEFQEQAINGKFQYIEDVEWQEPRRPKNA